MAQSARLKAKMAEIGRRAVIKERQTDIRKDFRYGARVPVAKKIWNQIIATQESQDALAQLIDVNAKIVSEGKNQGSLSFDVLVLLLSVLDEEFNYLEEMPSSRERALNGYLKAVSRARNTQPGVRTPMELSRIELSALLHLHGDPDYVSADECDEALWRLIIARVRPLVAKELGIELSEVNVKSPANFKKLEQTWLKALIETQYAVGYDFSELGIRLDA